MTQSKYLITSTSTPNSIVQRDSNGSSVLKSISIVDETGSTTPIKVNTTVSGFFGNLLSLSNTPDYGATPVFKVDQTGNLTCQQIQANASISSLSSINAGVTGITSGGSVSAAKNLTGGFLALGSVGTSRSLDYTDDMTISLTCTGTITLTATVPVAGSMTYLIITTSGTTSRTITFSTANFVTTGTLATGTVSGKIFTISFISDGSKLIETARTVAM